MRAPEPKTRKLTPQDVKAIVGDLDDAKIPAILATCSRSRARSTR